MRQETKTRSASISGTSDLTIIAPIRKGFVPSLDSVTYKTRVQRVLKALHMSRTSSHEYEFARALSDAVERVGRIHSIRIAILEPEDKVMLAVTFDGSWESYIRAIWQKVSRLLDLIFCNTEGYALGWTGSYEEWCAWLRQAQAETMFLYSLPGHTQLDTQYLKIQERVVRRTRNLADGDLAVTRISLSSPEEAALKIYTKGIDPGDLELGIPLTAAAAGRPAFRQGLKGLAGLYRLADMYLPGTADGDVLHRAAVELLREFLAMLKDGGTYQDAIKRANNRFEDALLWLQPPPLHKTQTDRLIPPIGDGFTKNRVDLKDIQGGVIKGYPDVTDGCLLLMAFDSASALGGFLKSVQATTAADKIAPGGIAINVSLTLEGLRVCGLTDAEINLLPQEFVQGMERRAGMLGDVRSNHPRRWRRPPLNWHLGVAANDVSETDPCARVDLAAVHLMLQLRITQRSMAPNETAPPQGGKEPLLAKIKELVCKEAKGQDESDKLKPGTRPLSLQWMHRMTVAGSPEATTEHFGFLDSQSEPVFEAAKMGDKFKNLVNLGEVILGYPNAADFAPEAVTASSTSTLLRNGSFFIVRKLRQDIAALESALTTAVTDKILGETALNPSEQRNLLLAKMMGRWPVGSTAPGKALATSIGNTDNDFSFKQDPEGSLCPYHAHIRRANPRDKSVPEPPGARPARLFRRGMSYGPDHDRAETVDEKIKASLAQERGLIFMAYNASIGEQFEVVQRWLSGGNSSGSFSGQGDPFLGVAESGRKRFFRFENEEQTVRMALDGTDLMHDEPQPIVRLEWGMYLFTPSISAIDSLAQRAVDLGPRVVKSWSVERGQAEINRLRAVEKSESSDAAALAWKVALEDPESTADFTSASIWAAIRERHGGVLKTSFGTLVGSRKLVDQVLKNAEGHLTVNGYLPRMRHSFGPIFLGMDANQADSEYERESTEPNAAILALDAKQAFEDARTVTAAALDELANEAIGYAKADCERHWEVTFEVREVINKVLAHFCETWFGLAEDGDYFKKGGYNWNWTAEDTPRYPGHFIAPSRYFFQPHPGADVERIGGTHGQVLLKNMGEYLAKFGKNLRQPIARAVLDADAARTDRSYAARTLTGMVIGFVPTTDANLRRVLNQWLTEDTLWALRAEFQSLPNDKTAEMSFSGNLCKKFVLAMQLCAAPELLWRTATVGHTIGTSFKNRVSVKTGEIVIASLVSATQESLEAGKPDLHHAFGGKRGSGKFHPTHACPGYQAAMGVMMGVAHGLVESKLALRPAPAAMTLAMDGYVELSTECSSAMQTAALVNDEASPGAGLKEIAFDKGLAFKGLNLKADAALFGAADLQNLLFTKAKTTSLLAIGDSWLNDFGLITRKLGAPETLVNALSGLSYNVDDSLNTYGRLLAEMADTVYLDSVIERLSDLKGEPNEPRAILLGGGGNDVAHPKSDIKKSPLYAMLNLGAQTASTALNGTKVTAFIDGTLVGYYKDILKRITAKTNLPILIHGYDHPIPDGQGFKIFGFPADPWLQPVFKEARIIDNLQVRRDIMKELIDRLNKMVKGLETFYPGQVHYVKLTGILAGQTDYLQNYKKYWSDELHPTTAGFKLLAEEIKNKLTTLHVP